MINNFGALAHVVLKRTAAVFSFRHIKINAVHGYSRLSGGTPHTVRGVRKVGKI